MIAFGAAAFDVTSLVMITIAYKADKSGFVSLFSYTIIVYAYVADILLLDEQLNTVELLSASTIFITALGVAYFKLRQQW